MALFGRARKKRKSPPAPPPRRLTLAIEEIGAQGDGVGRDGGEPVYTPLTAPGDVAVIEARGPRGRLFELLEAGPDRAEPPCIHYGGCGGCSLQHVTGAFYRDWKKARVAEALARAGLADAPIADMIETPVASRRRVAFAVKRRKHGIVFGLNARHSAEIVSLTDCVILHPELRAGLPALRALAEAVPGETFDFAVTHCQNGFDVNIEGEIAEPRGRALLALTDAADAGDVVRLSLNREALVVIEPPVVDVSGVALTPPPGAFLQASREGETALAGLVAEGVGSAARVADLFAGCGVFALPLARSATVTAIDADEAALNALMAAVGAAQTRGEKITPIRVETRNLFERPLSQEELQAFDAVIFDPPRAGANAQAAALAKSAVPRVIGVSCNPATFARDAALLVAGGYRLENVTPVDQFVYSSHIEIVGLFRKE